MQAHCTLLLEQLQLSSDQYMLARGLLLHVIIGRPCSLPAALSCPCTYLCMSEHAWQTCISALQALEGIPVESAQTGFCGSTWTCLVDNMNFTFPIKKYAGKDMILHGDDGLDQEGRRTQGYAACTGHTSCKRHFMWCE